MEYGLWRSAARAAVRQSETTLPFDGPTSNEMVRPLRTARLQLINLHIAFTL